MSTIDPALLAAAEHLGQLPPQERERAQHKLRGLTLAATPEDEIGRPPVRKLGEYLDDKIELPPMLVEPGLVARGAITSLTSRGGKGKTTMTLNRVIRWAMEKPLFDEMPNLLRPVKPLVTLIIENEGAPGHFQKSMQTILDQGEFTDEERNMARDNILIWGDGGWSGLKLDNDDNYKLVDRACATHKPDILFIEPMRGLWSGDENNSTDMNNLLDRLSGLANTYDCGVLITHHERKSGVEAGGDPMSAARGSGALEGHAAVMERWKPVKGDRHRELSWSKNRFDERPAPIRMEFDRDTWGYRLVKEDEVAMTALQVLINADDWLFVSEVADELDEDQKKVRRLLDKACESGNVTKRRMHTPSGGSGFGYRYKNGEDDTDGGGMDLT